MHGVCEPTPSSQRESVVLQAPRPEGAGRLRREAAPAPSRSPVTRVMTRGNYRLPCLHGESNTRLRRDESDPCARLRLVDRTPHEISSRIALQLPDVLISTRRMMNSFASRATI